MAKSDVSSYRSAISAILRFVKPKITILGKVNSELLLNFVFASSIRKFKWLYDKYLFCFAPSYVSHSF